MTYLLDDKIGYDDTANLTAFGRLRTSEARLLGEWRYMYGSGTSVEMNDKLVGGGVLVSNHAKNSYLGQVGTASGDRVVRQTKQYNPYIAGTSNIGMLTFTMNESKENLKQSVGLFDDYNGFLFRMNENVAEVVVRKSADYSTVSEEVVPQENWNIDRLDGSMNEYNQSGVLADFSKSQILVIDYQWLGIGRVRFGFVIDGKIIYVHAFNHANYVTEVYTTQPSLPCRWEIENVGITESSSEIMIICAAVYCEGSDNETGFLRSVSTGNTNVSIVNSNGGVGVLAIRLKNTLLSKPNHAMARVKNFSVVSDNDVRYKLVILNSKNYLANSNISWNTVPGYGWCEYITNFSLAPNWSANNDYLVIDDSFASGSSGNKTGSVENNSVNNRNCTIYQNYDSNDSQILALVCYYLGTTVNVRASLSWIETK